MSSTTTVHRGATVMPRPKPGGRSNDHRATLDGMMWVLKSGLPIAPDNRQLIKWVRDALSS